MGPFDKFPSMDAAEAFVVEARERFGLDGQTFTTDEESYRDDPGPFYRRPPIAHVVDRVDLDDRDADIARVVAAEERVETLAIDNGDEFIGT